MITICLCDCVSFAQIQTFIGKKESVIVDQLNKSCHIIGMQRLLWVHVLFKHMP